MKRFRIRRIRKGIFFTFPLQRCGKWVIWELRRFLVPVIVFCVIMVALVLVSTIDFPWQGWKLTTGFPDRVFCETPHSGSVRQPMNAWSSIIFVTVGLWAARRAFLDKIPSPRQMPVRRYCSYGLIFGTALVLMGIGSWFFHASLTYIGHFTDVLGMYMLAVFLFMYAFSRKLSISPSAFILLYIGITIPITLLQWHQPEIGRYVFAAMIVSAVGLEILIHKALKNGNFVFSLLCLALGFSIWLLDEKKMLCAPDSFLQGHALWHILTGISTQFSYLYYRSEAPRPNIRIAYRPGMAWLKFRKA